jgi:putative hydrolase of the HAD superfamily
MYRHLGLRVEPRVILQAEQTYWSEFLGVMEPLTGLVDFLALARQRGMEISVVTDLTSQIQLRKLIRLGIESWVDSLITSEEIGHDKSQPGTFSIVLEMLKVPRNGSVWFVGDEAKDFPNEDDFGTMSRTTEHRYFLRTRRPMGDMECFQDFRELLRELEQID